MAGTGINYHFENGIATIEMDDGKRNALSPAVFAAINAALDKAEADKAIVILTGRVDVFSAGFDLKVMKKGGANALRMLHAGYSLTARVMAYPYPVICACNGHVLAMGVFLMLSADYVIGSRGDYKVSANEVALGLTMPRVAAAMLKHRLKPAAFQRAVTLSQYFNVDDALAAGFFDELVEPAELAKRAQELAASYVALDMRAHKASKRRIRGAMIRYVRRSVPLDLWDAVLLGLRGGKPRSAI